MRRVVTAVLLSLSLVLMPIATTGCGASLPSVGEIADVFDAATLALEALDAAEVQYLEGIDVPTPEDIARAESHAKMAIAAREHLKQARDAIRAGDLLKARSELRSALDGLSAIADELMALGVKLPPEVERGLSLLRTLAGPAPAS